MTKSGKLTNQDGLKPEQKAAIQKAKELEGIRLKYMKDFFTNGVQLSKEEESALKGYVIGRRKAIVTVGHYNVRTRNSGSEILRPDRKYIEDVTSSYLTIPFAYVHKAGDWFQFNAVWGRDGNLDEEGVKIKEKGFIRLFDWRTNTIVNPTFEAYYDNEYTNSNAERADNAPNYLRQKAQDYYAQENFMILPYKTPQVRDYFTFRLDISDVMCLFEKRFMYK